MICVSKNYTSLSEINVINMNNDSISNISSVGWFRLLELIRAFWLNTFFNTNRSGCCSKDSVNSISLINQVSNINENKSNSQNKQELVLARALDYPLLDINTSVHIDDINDININNVYIERYSVILYNLHCTNIYSLNTDSERDGEGENLVVTVDETLFNRMYRIFNKISNRIYMRARRMISRTVGLSVLDKVFKIFDRMSRMNLINKMNKISSVRKKHVLFKISQFIIMSVWLNYRESVRYW